MCIFNIKIIKIKKKYENTFNEKLNIYDNVIEKTIGNICSSFILSTIFLILFVLNLIFFVFGLYSCLLSFIILLIFISVKSFKNASFNLLLISSVFICAIAYGYIIYLYRILFH